MESLFSRTQQKRTNIPHSFVPTPPQKVFKVDSPSYPTNETKSKTVLDSLLENSSFKKEYEALQEKMGNSLYPLKAAETPILGREEELEQLQDKLRRRKAAPLLIGQAGTGKTSLVEEWVRRKNEEYNTGLGDQKVVVFSLSTGKLSADGIERLKIRVENLLPSLEDLEAKAKKIDSSVAFVLFIDEIHMIITQFGVGSKLGGDLLKQSLGRTPLRVIGATTRKEYQNTILPDEPLARRFQNIQIFELQREAVKVIARGWWKSFGEGHPAPKDAMLDYIFTANAMYRGEFAEPAKMIDTLDDCLAAIKNPLIENKVVTKDIVNRIFDKSYGINLSLKFDYEHVIGKISKKIKGQGYAIKRLGFILQALNYRLDPFSNKPLVTGLLTGPSGVGKTETIKQLAKNIYPDRDVFRQFDMTDYILESSESKFRNEIADFVSNERHAILLFDELEKAASNIQDLFMKFLEVGKVKASISTRENAEDEWEFSLKNCMIFATTNSGADIFNEESKFKRDVDYENDEEAMEELMRSLRSNLEANDWRPELLNRFDDILPYSGLSEQAYVEISSEKLEGLITRLKEVQGFEVVVPPDKEWKEVNDAYDFFGNEITIFVGAEKIDSGSPSQAGARKVAQYLGENGTLFRQIVDFRIKNPEIMKVRVGVTKKARIWDTANPTNGGKFYVEKF